MDIELARTFLEIVAAGNFVRAAERLHVTQSTVSMRIKQLENQLGRVLFARGKGGASLTAAGTRFLRHAETLVRVWQQARQEIGLAPEYRAVLNVGGQFSLWDRLLLRWVGWMRSALPEVALRAEVGQSDELMRQLVEGALDIGVMYTPQSRPGLVVEKLLDDTFVLVATAHDHPGVVGEDYVYVDWGREFLAAHSAAFPDLRTPGLYVGLGALGLRHILDRGGAGYFPARVVRPLLDRKRLHRVRDAPEFYRPAFVVYRTREESDRLRTALDGLRAHAAAEAGA